MSMTLQEAEYEQGMEELYREFKQQYEEEYIFEQIHTYYKDNPDIPKSTLNYYRKALSLFSENHHTSAFLLATISIEVSVKVIIMKPILFSLAFNDTAGELLYNYTFKRKSVPEIPNLYYQILQDTTGFDFKKHVRATEQKTLWEELTELQKIRNQVIHQAESISDQEATIAINLARSIHEEVIPSILNRFHFHIKDDRITYGTGGNAEILAKIENLKETKDGS